MKTYIKPELNVEGMCVEEMIALSLGIGEGTISGNDVESKGRRGVWGDLWFEEDDVEE